MQTKPKSELKSYYAPLPAGQGIMIVEDGDTTHRFLAQTIEDIRSEEGSDRVYLYRSNDYVRINDANIHILEDMRLRALRGEIARTAEYHESGLRIDGTPLIMMQDYEIKEKIAEQRRNQKQNKIDLANPLVILAKDSIEPPAADVQLSDDERMNKAPVKPEKSPMPAPPKVPSKIEEEAKNIPPEDIHEIGTHIENKGVYVGPFEYKWKKRGKKENLSRVFDIYTASHDLRAQGERGNLTATFGDLISEVAGIQNIEGYAGIRIESNWDLIRYLQSDTDQKMLENWFLPTLDILSKQIHFNRAKGSLMGTFNVDEGAKSFWNGNVAPSCYASLTLTGSNKSSSALDFRTGNKETVRPSTKLSARPIRMEWRP